MSTTANAQDHKPSDLADRALRVSDRVVIREIALLAAKLTRRNVPEGMDLPVQVQRQTHAEMNAETKLLRVQVDLAFTARESDDSENPASVEVRATYEVKYEVPDDSNLTQENYDAFGELNGTFNAWPYFREFLQSSLVRMGLPPFTLPVLRVGTSDSQPAASGNP